MINIRGKEARIVRRGGGEGEGASWRGWERGRVREAKREEGRVRGSGRGRGRKEGMY